MFMITKFVNGRKLLTNLKKNSAINNLKKFYALNKLKKIFQTKFIFFQNYLTALSSAISFKLFIVSKTSSGNIVSKLSEEIL